jgi:hypothetical protein
MLDELARIEAQMVIQEFFTVPRLFQVAFPGRDTNGFVAPTVAFNVSTVERTAPGTYVVTLVSLFSQLDADTAVYQNMDCAVTAVSEAFQSNTDPGPGADQFTVYTQQQVLGAGSKLEWELFDPQPTDSVNIIGLSEMVNPPAVPAIQRRAV